MNKAKKMLNNNNKGFTLIELLVVVAILAILALIVLLALNPVEMARRSRDSRRLSDLGTLRKAIDLSLSDGGTMATVATTNVNTATDVTNFAGTGLDISKYLSVAPQDPVNDGSANTTQVANTTCVAGTAAKNTMNYQFITDGDTYVLRTRVESLENCDAIDNDGNADNFYELGTDPGLNMFP